MFCSKCGQEVSDEAQYCSACGNALQSNGKNEKQAYDRVLNSYVIINEEVKVIQEVETVL